MQYIRLRYSILSFD